MSGWGAAVFNIFATFPVNKTVFRQVVYNISMRDALKQLTSEGVIYIYRGILPPLLQKSACSSLMFGTYSHYSRIITDTIGSKDNQVSEDIIFFASDVIPHIRNWIPSLPQRVFPCGSELISMRVRALFLAG